MMRPIAAVALCTLMLSGCSGSSGGGTADGVDYTSAKAIAAALDAGGFECTGWEPNTEVIGAREDGTCDHASSFVSVTTFNSAEQMKTVNEALAAFASGVSVKGDAWQVGVDDKDQAEQVRAIIGGNVS